ncbi:hypothetical protein [Aliarcobacter butzleri]|uniref:hypothetical protein n=1 Tax=Aliarcobacter butzleri TaxID=28197 RepID=UPI0024DE5920|nr:hypothetical protein [Aliarcobacter butzleri]MDK2082027.1 hypothetical protein [Aliarcobacter butzleri]
MKIIETELNEDGSYSAKNIANSKLSELDLIKKNPQGEIGVLQDVYNINNALNYMNINISQKISNLNYQIQSLENMNQRYWNSENNRQWIYHNEVNKYIDLMSKQNNLLGKINYPEIKLWRFKNLLYFRTNSGQLIIDNHIEIQKELSSRYGADVNIVNDINDVLRNNNQYRVNTIFVAINNIIIVEEEVFDNNQSFEIFNTYNGVWKRNLLAFTRFNKKRIPR